MTGRAAHFYDGTGFNYDAARRMLLHRSVRDTYGKRGQTGRFLIFLDSRGQILREPPVCPQV